MANKKTSEKRAQSSNAKPRRLSPDSTARPYDPAVRLRDPAFVQKAILEALKDGDFETVIDIYRAHLRVLNRSKTADSLNVSRQYVHKMLREKDANPSLRTFTAFMRMLAEVARRPD